MLATLVSTSDVFSAIATVAAAHNFAAIPASADFWTSDVSAIVDSLMVTNARSGVAVSATSPLKDGLRLRDISAAHSCRTALDVVSCVATELLRGIVEVGPVLPRDDGSNSGSATASRGSSRGSFGGSSGGGGGGGPSRSFVHSAPRGAKRASETLLPSGASVDVELALAVREALITMGHVPDTALVTTVIRLMDALVNTNRLTCCNNPGVCVLLLECVN